MPAFTIDDENRKQIVVHLDAGHTAAVIRSGASITVTKIRLQGKVGSGTDGSIVLRKNSVSGPIVYTFAAAAGGSDLQVNDDADFDGLAQIAATGLYLDGTTDAWAAGSKMIIYATRGN